MILTNFTGIHAARLRAVFREAAWREAVAGIDVERLAAELMPPGKTHDVFSLPVAQLLAVNQARVREMIAAGERDELRLLAALGAWPEEWPEGVPVRLAWVGINLGFACDMLPRCVYCNQQPVAECMSLEDWRRVMREVAGGEGEGPYISFTGGEPLMLGEGLWGAEGLLGFAAERGAACNLNTNALGLTPRVALGLVRSRLRRIHVSLDTHRFEVQDAIQGRVGRWRQVLRGLHNIQIAKALLKSEYPEIHINAVLTRLNADDFPEFLRFLVGMKPLKEGAVSSDFHMHLIPVGGEGNAGLRLSAAEYERFFTETWAAANEVWEEYQIARGVAEKDRGPLEKKIPFLSPYHRVEQRGDLREWAEGAARGRPMSLALGARCYVAPTQCFILPDGQQYWCGGHSVARPEAVGNVLEATVQENIRRRAWEMRCLPGAHCGSCAGATLAINQAVEARLRKAIQEWVGEGS